MPPPPKKKPWNVYSNYKSRFYSSGRNGIESKGPHKRALIVNGANSINTVNSHIARAVWPSVRWTRNRQNGMREIGI